MIEKIGVSADDITGSNDIGIMFTKAGLVNDVYSGEPGRTDADVIIIDTDSRFDDPKTAYDKVYNATIQLKKQGATRFYKKTCSVFRGNIGVEFDAMLDALNENFAVVVLGFPDNGRTTVNSVHYVNNIKLEDTQFRHDPMNPMHCSNLIDILSSQTKRKVEAIWADEIDQGEDYLRNRLKELEKIAQYVIFDVRDNTDLAKIAQVIKDQRVICGASAIAAYTGKYFKSGCHPSLKPKDIPDPGKGKLIIAGSLTVQTSGQIAHMRELGVKTLEFETLKILDEQACSEMKARLVDEACIEINSGKEVVIHTSNDPETVRLTKAAARGRGMDDSVASKLISSHMSDIAHEVIRRTGQRRIIIAGGDTSASFCARMGISGQRVYQEIQAGLPSCITLNGEPLWLVLKSGSFGSNDFFIHAVEHLNQV